MNIKAIISLCFLLSFSGQVFAERIMHIWGAYDPDFPYANTSIAESKLTSLEYYSNYYKTEMFSCMFSSGIICRKRQGYDFRTVASGTYSNSCPDGTELHDGICQNKCEALSGNSTSQTWDFYQYGDSPVVCSSGCTLKNYGVSLCFVKSGQCSGDMIITGETCTTGDGWASGGNVPDELPTGCKQVYDTYVCAKDTDGDGQPNDGAEYDTDAKCDYTPTGQFKCVGGTFTPSTPEINDPTQDVDKVEGGGFSPSNGDSINVDAPPTVDDKGDATGQIKQLNEQINKLLTNLNQDNNDNFRDVINQLVDANQHNTELTKQIIDGTNKTIEIYDNMRLANQSQTAEIVGAIGLASDYADFNHGQAMNEYALMSEYLRQISESLGESGGGDLEGITDAVTDLTDAITNVDTSGAGTGVPCIDDEGNNTCGSLYESELTQEEFSTRIQERMGETMELVTTGIVDSFTSLDLSGASKPSFSLDLSEMGFGRYSIDDYIDLDYVFLFVRICMLFTAAMTCRKLIFGG
ncbi:hypothetical protein ACPV51_07950 [Vibrio astriarenae]